jgi:electron transfer flavoprotein beta subunit
MKLTVLLSAGRHPVSDRPCPVPVDAQAIGLARRLGKAVGLHAGSDPALIRDYLGFGLDRITLLNLPPGSDPEAPLLAALKDNPPDLVLAGRRGQGGDDTGLLPYRLAHALGWPIVADAVSIAAEGGILTVDQALPRGARRRVTVALPALVTIHPAAPPAPGFAFGAIRRGTISTVPQDVPADPAPIFEERPYRRRPRLMRGVSSGGGSAGDRLRAATETGSSGGTLLIDPTPDAAATAILAFLAERAILRRDEDEA